MFLEMDVVKMTMKSPLHTFIDQLEVASIPTDRLQILQPLIDYSNKTLSQNEDLKLNFICTHNSRRSHLCQVWAAAMANYYDLSNILIFSGGTQVTAVYPMVIEALREHGLDIELIDDTQNPLFEVQIDPNSTLYLFSKSFDDSSNPDEGYAAILTCSQAADDCPFIPGADQRIAITYEDPKVGDNTPKEKEIYLERSLQIALEMKYVFSQINK